MNLSRLYVVFTAFFLALPAHGQGLVFQGGNSFIDREHDKDVTDGSLGAGLRALQERNPEIIVDRIITLKRSPDGHFYADIMVNGVEINFIVDTGATNIALTKQDARRIGIDLIYLDYSQLAQIANGLVKIAPTKLRSIIFGETKNYDFPAIVLDADTTKSLLGMSYLSQFGQIEIVDDLMVLHP